MANGRIFEIQHFSVHDGPGIRTTVFLKGCQLRCLWCHNPESIPTRPVELSYQPASCISCGQCVTVCPAGCHEMQDAVHQFDRTGCTLCGKCADACPARALTASGRAAEVEEIIKEVERDRAYYGEDGGMTLSGGEAMLQPDFVQELLQLAKAVGIHTALETNLLYSFSLLDNVRNHTDLFLVDWKESDPELHRQYTGSGNEKILDNLRALHNTGAAILLRCPIIPGCNYREDHFARIAELTIELPQLIGAELLPYHNLGVSKNARFGLDNLIPPFSADTPTDDDVRRWVEFTRSRGGRIINEV